MSLPKIRLEHCTLEPDGRWRLDAGQLRHLTKALRLYAGAAVEGLLPQDGGQRVQLRLERTAGEYFLRATGSAHELPDAISLTLLIGLLKADQFESVLRASAELGVSAIRPILCERSVPRIDAGALPQKMARWQRILEEGTKVSGAVFAPQMFPPVPFGEMTWEELPAQRYAAMLTHLAHPVASYLGHTGEMVFAVGPEGDWSDAETQALEENNFIPVRLGRRVLRASTAAIVGCGSFFFAGRTAEGA